MVNVDISNVWTCMSLPELLGCEQEVFDAHDRLRGAEEGADLMQWLKLPGAAEARLLRRVSEVAQLICEDSEVLLVCGCGGTYHGVKAAVEAFGRTDSLPQILFLGQTLSARQSLELSETLKEKDYSLFIISHDGADVAVNVTVRSLRWMMERKYGDEAKSRIYAATLVGTPLHTMAQEEGYELFPLPKQAGGAHTVLTAAALVPMAVAGIDPGAVLRGAAESFDALEIRSFENPAWLYAAVRRNMARRGRNRELLCLTDQALQGVGQWLQRQTRRQSAELCVETVLLPGDLEDMEQIAAGQAQVFETVLRFGESARRVLVEMDWKDYDGLGFLYGKSLGDVEAALLRGMIETHNNAGVPILDVDAGERNSENLGALLQFFELSSALTACLLGRDPFAPAGAGAKESALELLMGM